MIVKNDDAIARLLSPHNLMNRMKDLSKTSKTRNDAMSLFIKPEANTPKTIEPQPPVVQTQLIAAKTFNPFEKTEEIANSSGVSLDEISNDSEAKIALGLAHDSAVKLLNRSLSMLDTKLDDVQASKLPAVIAAASRTVESIRKERLEQSKSNKDRDVHYHFYTPEQKKLNDYEIIEVGG